MRKAPIRFLQAILILIGLGALAFLLLEPHLEGRNAHATVLQVYFNDPFLLYVYTGSIAFFFALYQTYTLLGCAARNALFSKTSVRALRKITYCALILTAFALGAEAHSFFIVRGTDDVAGGVVMGFVLIVISLVVATTSTVFEKILERAVELQSENDLTI